MTSRLGSNEMCNTLSAIEESFSKINFRGEAVSSKRSNLETLYKYFYNYLPSFFGQGFKGVAYIYEMGKLDTQKSFQLGVEYGFMLQFGIFSYILVAI